MSGPVKAVRILMFVVAGLTFLTTLAFLAADGLSADTIGAAIWSAAPGVVSLVLALRIPGGGPALRRGIIALEIIYILLALGRIGQGDPRGLPNLVIPIVLLVLLFRPAVKGHFSGTAGPAGAGSYL